jgi:tRNA (mo5U34)-methyltransferase
VFSASPSWPKRFSPLVLRPGHPERTGVAAPLSPHPLKMMIDCGRRRESAGARAGGSDKIHAMTLEEAKLAIASREWWHSIDLGPELGVTPGSCTPEHQRLFMRNVGYPERFDGLSVLDIGSYDGGFAFEAERRGAARVVAVDVHPIDCRCLGLAKEILGSKVEYQMMSAYDLNVEALGGPFDVVFFFGVYYHLRYPLLALDKIWPVVKPGGYMLMETHVIDECIVLPDGQKKPLSEVAPLMKDIPIYQFYRLNELSEVDYSNWFGPNIEAAKQALWSAGFKPTLLSQWSWRAAFKAEKIDEVQEWRKQTYEGTEFTFEKDGSWRVHWLTHRQ